MDSPLMEELDAITEGKSKLDLAEEIWRLRRAQPEAGRTAKEIAKGALLHGMLQLRICSSGSGSKTIAELQAAAHREKKWVLKRLNDYGLTWDDLSTDFREFYKNQIKGEPSTSAGVKAMSLRGRILTGGNMMKPPIPVGTKVEPWGTISDVHDGQRERFYAFFEKGVALIPAYAVESAYAQQERRK